MTMSPPHRAATQLARVPAVLDVHDVRSTSPTPSCCSAPPATSPSASCSRRSTTSSGTGSSSVPVIGVARSDWTDDDVPRRTPATSIDAARRGRRPAVIDGCGAPRPDPGRLRRPATWQALADTLERHGSKQAVFYMAIPPSMFPTVAEALASVGPQRARPDRRREAVRPRPGVGPRAERHAALGVPRGAHLPHRPLPRQGERRGPARVPLLQHAARADLEPATTCAACRSRWPRRSASRAAAASTTASAPSATCCRTTCCRWSSLLAMEPPVGPESQLPAGREGQGAARRCGRSTRAGSCAASTSATATSRASPRLERRDVRRGAARDRLVALGRRAVVRPRRQGARRRPPPRPWSSSQRRRACCSTRPADRRPAATSSASASASTTASRSRCRPRRPGPHLDSQEVDVDVDFAAALGERREAYERLLGDAIAGLAPPLRPPGRGRADVAGRPAGARPTRARAPVLPRDVGSRRGRPPPRRRPLVRAVRARRTSEHRRRIASIHFSGAVWPDMRNVDRRSPFLARRLRHPPHVPAQHQLAFGALLAWCTRRIRPLPLRPRRCAIRGGDRHGRRGGSSRSRDPGPFWPMVAAAGTAQIIATVALLQAFRAHFTLGTVYSKTEVIQVAIVEHVAAPRAAAPARMDGRDRVHRSAWRGWRPTARSARRAGPATRPR